MIWLANVCFLALRLSSANSALCAYRIGDREGTGYHKLMAEIHIKISLHGEFSHIQKKKSGGKCDNIDLSIIQPLRMWYSFKSETEHEFSDSLQKHECKKHRFDDEDSNAFIMRAMNTCKDFSGYLHTVYCRVDDRNRLNVVREVILQDRIRSNIRKNGCHASYQFAMPWGLRINVLNRQEYSVNLTTEKFFIA
ncbi:hypothetical protein RF11_08987 [Thelohanellus kitauei]|uniref:Uncharacterized protein n=1 Tax=Thelohanellus kitauei TaxID=669202 RepID=A0A0C2M6Z6_THEKT|nr:hypothetical protein RF11_08987 [Thelohanellus kitauei]